MGVSLIREAGCAEQQSISELAAQHVLLTNAHAHAHAHPADVVHAAHVLAGLRQKSEKVHSFSTALASLTIFYL